MRIGSQTGLFRGPAPASRESGTLGTETGLIPAVGVGGGGHRHNPEATFKFDLNAAKYVGCLFGACCFFVLPFPLLSLVRIGRTAAVFPRPFSYAMQLDVVVTLLFENTPVPSHPMPNPNHKP